MTDWLFHQPKFDYQPFLTERSDTYGWLGHTYLAYDLIANIKPTVVVELGTHWGVSFFSFCQAAKDVSLKTELTAVDTWKGEDQAGFYSETVYKTVHEITQKYFPQVKIKLLRKTFDEALAKFEDGSVDLLHIDGLHTYEAVKHDFDSWLPKLSNTAVVLFHDTAEHQPGFGVDRFWKELKKKYPQTLELRHSHGLGVLCLDEKLCTVIKPLQKTWQAHYGLAHEKEILTKDHLKTNLEFERTKKKLTKTIEQLAQTQSTLDGVITHDQQLTKTLAETVQHAQNLQAIIDDIRSSKAYKLVHGLGSLKRIIKR